MHSIHIKGFHFFTKQAQYSGSDSILERHYVVKFNLPVETWSYFFVKKKYVRIAVVGLKENP